MAEPIPQKSPSATPSLFLPSGLYLAEQLLKGAQAAEGVVGLHAAGPRGRRKVKAVLHGISVHQRLQEGGDAGVPRTGAGEDPLRFIAALKELPRAVGVVQAGGAALDEQISGAHGQDLPGQGADILLPAEDGGHIPTARPATPGTAPGRP